jgi:hypothetical protein
MKSNSVLSILLTAALACHVLAGQFVVITGPSSSTTFSACRGDDFGVCACVENGETSPAFIPDGGTSPLVDMFEIENLCGNSQLEVYPFAGEGIANVYIFGAPKTIVATCDLVAGQASQTCGSESDSVIDGLWDCFSDTICP